MESGWKGTLRPARLWLRAATAVHAMRLLHPQIRWTKSSVAAQGAGSRAGRGALLPGLKSVPPSLNNGPGLILALRRPAPPRPPPPPWGAGALGTGCRGAGGGAESREASGCGKGAAPLGRGAWPGSRRPGFPQAFCRCWRAGAGLPPPQCPEHPSFSSLCLSPSSHSFLAPVLFLWLSQPPPPAPPPPRPVWAVPLPQTTSWQKRRLAS